MSRYSGDGRLLWGLVDFTLRVHVHVHVQMYSYTHNQQGFTEWGVGRGETLNISLKCPTYPPPFQMS